MNPVSYVTPYLDDTKVCTPLILVLTCFSCFCCLPVCRVLELVGVFVWFVLLLLLGCFHAPL